MTNSTSPLKSYRQASNLTLKEVGERLGVNKTTVLRWEEGSRRIPAERVIDLERLTGAPRHQLRPDLYPPESKPAMAEQAVS